jgi:hypothetical protein
VIRSKKATRLPLVDSQENTLIRVISENDRLVWVLVEAKRLGWNRIKISEMPMCGACQTALPLDTIKVAQVISSLG